MIHTGDCIEVMATMPADSVDAVVTDPPYGLEFMGKGWDKFGAVVEHPDDGEGPWGRTARVRYAAGHSFQAWCEAWGREALRVTRSGGYLLAFGGTRTHHRLVCGLEDAGWIIRDELDWIYASGFPKGKANLKPAHEPIVLARKPGPLRPLAIDECRIPGAVPQVTQGVNSNGAGYRVARTMQESEPHDGGRWPSNLLLQDPELFDEPNPYVVGSGATSTDGVAVNRNRPDKRSRYEASAYEIRLGPADDAGYGGGGGYSRFFRVPEYGRSGILSVCRTCGVPIAESSSTGRTPPLDTAPPNTATLPPESSAQSASDAGNPSPSPSTATAPSHAPTPTDGMPDSMVSGDAATRRPSTRPRRTATRPAVSPTTTSQPPTDASSAAQSGESIVTTTTMGDPLTCASCADAATLRNTQPPQPPTALELTPAALGNYPIGLIVPKADRADREPIVRGQLPESAENFMAGLPDPRMDRPQIRNARANSHPTVKPTDLMRHLVRLVTPSGGTVLDPFLGSGSTAIACELEGFPWIGIEKEPEYVAIAEARLNGVQRGLGLDVAAPTKRQSGLSGWRDSDRPTDARGVADSFGAANVTGRHYDDGTKHSARSPRPKPDNASMFDEEPAA